MTMKRFIKYIYICILAFSPGIAIVLLFKNNYNIVGYIAFISALLTMFNFYYLSKHEREGK
jgi:hypothetical protein